MMSIIKNFINYKTKCPLCDAKLKLMSFEPSFLNKSVKFIPNIKNDTIYFSIKENKIFKNTLNDCLRINDDNRIHYNSYYIKAIFSGKYIESIDLFCDICCSFNYGIKITLDICNDKIVRFENLNEYPIDIESFSISDYEKDSLYTISNFYSKNMGEISFKNDNDDLYGINLPLFDISQFDFKNHDKVISKIKTYLSLA